MKSASLIDPGTEFVLISSVNVSVNTVPASRFPPAVTGLLDDTLIRTGPALSVEAVAVLSAAHVPVALSLIDPSLSNVTLGVTAVSALPLSVSVIVISVTLTAA